MVPLRFKDIVPELSRRGGPAFPNRYLAVIDRDRKNVLPMFCQSAVLPGLSIETMNQNHYGVERRLPNGFMNYQDLELQFMVSNSFQERKFIERWMNQILDRSHYEPRIYDGKSPKRAKDLAAREAAIDEDQNDVLGVPTGRSGDRYQKSVEQQQKDLAKGIRVAQDSGKIPYHSTITIYQFGPSDGRYGFPSQQKWYTTLAETLFKGNQLFEELFPPNMNVVYGVKFIEAFPTNMTEMALSYETVDTMHTFSTTFHYKEWHSLGESEMADFESGNIFGTSARDIGGIFSWA